MVAIRADSIINLRCFGIPLALIVWSFHEGKCPVFPAWTTKALDSLWLRMSRLCSASLVPYPREVSPRYCSGQVLQGTAYTWLSGRRCGGLFILTKSPNLIPLLVAILMEEPASC